MPRHSVIVHAHLYQPPREDPWLDLVEQEHSALPFHDWNTRIALDCYRPLAAARLLTPAGRIRKILNTYHHMSFNVGPTLLDWLDDHAPDVVAALVTADRESRGRLGVGNAMAMPFHHVILPLASPEDRRTEIRWGIADFRRRFGRHPEGMWLPETAVDEDTLALLAEEGIAFTILAPHQVENPPDDGLPLRFRAGGGREIALMVYDGTLAHDVAFGPLIQNAEVWIERMLRRSRLGSPPSATSLAADGETWGHHHPFGEMALARMLEQAGREDVCVENYGSLLARHAPRTDARLIGPSSWSCAHGVGRWQADCGCRLVEGTEQSWRAPLRQGLDHLRQVMHARSRDEMRALIPDPAAARDGLAGQPPARTMPIRARELLEMERNLLRMYTSCGWFFDDVAGLETLICLRYAARAIDLGGWPDVEPPFLEILDTALGNDPLVPSAGYVWRHRVRRGIPPDARAAAAAAATEAVTGILPDRVGAWAVSRPTDGAVRVEDARTGTFHDWQVEFPLHAGPGITCLVAGDGWRGHVSFADLPEVTRHELRTRWIPALRHQVLSPREWDSLANGDANGGTAAARALVRLVQAEPPDTDALKRALDLLTLEDMKIPFEAQTHFFHRARNSSSEVRRSLAPLAEAFEVDPSLFTESAPHD